MSRVAARTFPAFQAVVAFGGDLLAAGASMGNADVTAKAESGRDPEGFALHTLFYTNYVLNDFTQKVRRLGYVVFYFINVTSYSSDYVERSKGYVFYDNLLYFFVKIIKFLNIRIKRYPC